MELIFCHELSWLKGVSDTRSGPTLITAVRKDEGLAEAEKELLYFCGNELSQVSPVSLNCSLNMQVCFCWKGHY